MGNRVRLGKMQQPNESIHNSLTDRNRILTPRRRPPERVPSSLAPAQRGGSIPPAYLSRRLPEWIQDNMTKDNCEAIITNIIRLLVNFQLEQRL